ncbi:MULTISPECIES: hypothetical protein [Pseudomonas]|uniref:hypothetical protein n=1 Tax=Pseudomonas TaxID=286 RepID=UPI001C30A31A|nr:MULTISPECIES: hypothetical protein [Pseudomonas]MBV2081955.1 hypothetical protein [Pseudomonas carnis]MBV2087840.1 hypothetical protein [Pseudomonas carnis]MDO3691759.1 hypothetical protein [Pseudomonas sp. DKN 2791]MDO7033478.1 hypothetical protein [Pseudomonas sp. DKN 2792]
MSAAQLIFTSEVYGLPMRVLSHTDKHWLCSEDLAKVFEYRTRDGVSAFYSRHKKKMEALSIKTKINGEGWDVRLFDEFGVRYLCEYSKRPGAFHLLRWLDAGGMQANTATTDSTPVAANVLAFKLPATASPGNHDERQKAYCRELLKTLLRYSIALEAEELTHIIEAEVVNLISRRHCPGLNDARYEVFRRYWLQGGDA